MLKKFKEGRNPQDGRWLAEPTWRAVARAEVVQVAATETGWSWRDVVDELEHDGLGVDQSQVRHESYVSLYCANVRKLVGPLRSLMRHLSSERHHQKKKVPEWLKNFEQGLSGDPPDSHNVAVDDMMVSSEEESVDLAFFCEMVQETQHEQAIWQAQCF